MVSDSASKWALGMQHWRDSELDRINKKLLGDESDDEDKWGSNLESGSSLIHIGDDQFSSLDVKTSFSLDWGSMKFTWLGKVKMAIKIAVRDALRDNYDVICHLFLHYCGVGKGEFYQQLFHICFQ